MSTVTFDTLCARHGLATVDVVQIDTEGYDHEIVRRIDLARYRPKLVMYENLHLAGDDRAACEGRLRAAGYELFSNPMDMVALHRDVLAAHRSLRRTWDGAETEDVST